MLSSSLLELFDGGIDAGTGGPNIVKDEVGGGLVKSGSWLDGKSMLGLSETGVFIGTNLNSILGTDEKGLEFNGFVFREVFGNF